MRNSLFEFMETIFSLAVFAVIALAFASTTYQIFNPDGGLIQWLAQVWEVNPALLVLLGGSTLLVKFWLSGQQGARVADIMFYTALALGLYYGHGLLMA